jgi:hypothetical protein
MESVRRMAGGRQPAQWSTWQPRGQSARLSKSSIDAVLMRATCLEVLAKKRQQNQTFLKAT